MADEHHHPHDPTFYRTPRDAAEASPEKLAYVAAFSRPADQPDAIAVLDVDPDSARDDQWLRTGLHAGRPAIPGPARSAGCAR